MAISAPTGAREGKCFLDRHGLTKAGLFAGLTLKLSRERRPADASRLSDWLDRISVGFNNVLWQEDILKDFIQNFRMQ